MDLEIPKIAWRGLFEDYRLLVTETTEASDAFHYAVFLQVLGCTLGRKLYVYHATRLFPNFYVCLVGLSGITRKDTCLSRGNNLLNRLHEENEMENINPQFRIVKGIRSYEGLLDELSGLQKVRLIQVGELLTLLAKARQNSLGNIIPALTELYDCPDRVNPPIHQKSPADCREPFTSIIAATTQAWLEVAFTEMDIYGGFANRWVYFFGLPKEPKPNPPKVDSEKQDQLLIRINEIRTWANNIPDGEITASSEANSLFEDYYREYYYRCQNKGIIPTLIVRIQDFIWKIALLYAADDLSEVITVDHLQAAICVGEYLEASVTEVFASFGESAGKDKETKFLTFLRSEGKPVLEREAYRKLNIRATELQSMAQALVKLGLIRMGSETSSNGRQMNTYEAI